MEGGGPAGNRSRDFTGSFYSPKLSTLAIRKLLALGIRVIETLIPNARVCSHPGDCFAKQCLYTRIVRRRRTRPKEAPSTVATGTELTGLGVRLTGWGLMNMHYGIASTNPVGMRNTANDGASIRSSGSRVSDSAPWRRNGLNLTD
jgi:hypothetical protein